MRRAAALAALAALAGCGGGGGGDHTNTTLSVTRPAALPKKVETATVPKATAPPTTTTKASGPESSPGGAGDEQGPRIPAAYSVQGGKLTPPSIAVPAFLPIQFSVRNGDGAPHVMTLHAHVLKVPAHSARSILIPGLKKGRYPITVDGQAAGLLVTGAAPGP